MTTNHSGYDNIPPPTTRNSQIEEMPVREGITKDFYLLLSSAKVFKRTEERLRVCLVFENGLAKSALVDPGAYVIAITQNKLNRFRK